MTASSTLAELPIPKPLHEVIAVIMFQVFICFFVGLAIQNLAEGVALVGSSLWLLLVGSAIFGACKQNGMRKFMVNVLGTYSRRRFVCAISRPDAPTVIEFGFRLFGIRLLDFVIPVERIETVYWSPGQATSMAGRDMKDWSVAIWYEHGDSAKAEEKADRHKPHLDVYIVGPSRKKELTAAFGRSFVEFLRKAGAALGQGKDEKTFVRATATSQADSEINDAKASSSRA
jgi:hypothetical protein